jgi:hypothetical protein
VPTGVLDPAPMLTEAIGNVYAPLSAPSWILDTRSASGRANILNPSGNLDSHGRLLAGKTITISAYSLVCFADALFANLTVTVTDAAARGLSHRVGRHAKLATECIVDQYRSGRHALQFRGHRHRVGVSGGTDVPVFAIYAEKPRT